MSGAITLRPVRVGDMGWVIHRQAVIYAERYGWDMTFEAMLAKVAAEFIERFDSKTDIGLIAERDGAILGSAFVVAKSTTTAKLRLVYVEPAAQGAGVGRQLVEACLTFARDAGYTHMTLWTNDVLVAARKLYERLGFTLTYSEPYSGFGQNLVGETWDRPL